MSSSRADTPQQQKQRYASMSISNVLKSYHTNVKHYDQSLVWYKHWLFSVTHRKYTLSSRFFFWPCSKTRTRYMTLAKGIFGALRFQSVKRKFPRSFGIYTNKTLDCFFVFFTVRHCVLVEFVIRKHGETQTRLISIPHISKGRVQWRRTPFRKSFSPHFFFSIFLFAIHFLWF